MTSNTPNIIKTLELLVMLSRFQQQFQISLTEENENTIKISRQLITDAGLTIPEFTNAVTLLSDKGYIWHLIIFDENLRAQLDEFINGGNYDKFKEKIQQLDTEETSNNLKLVTTESIQKILPCGTELDQVAIDNDFIKISEMFDVGIQAIKELRLDEIAIIFLMPFRDINILLEKLNSGEKLSTIQDDGFWYDQNKFEFHIDGQIIPTSYQGKPNKEHHILSEFFNNRKMTTFDYDQLADIDKSISTKTYRDSMRKFIKKHPKLKLLFTAREYQTEFHPDQYRHIP